MKKPQAVQVSSFVACGFFVSYLIGYHTIIIKMSKSNQSVHGFWIRTVKVEKKNMEGSIFALPPISLIRDFSNQNTCGNVSKISVSHTNDIPYTCIWRCFISSRVNFKIESYKLLKGKIIL